MNVKTVELIKVRSFKNLQKNLKKKRKKVLTKRAKRAIMYKLA